jgi:hypothetical protein
MNKYDEMIIGKTPLTINEIKQMVGKKVIVKDMDNLCHTDLHTIEFICYDIIFRDREDKFYMINAVEDETIEVYKYEEESTMKNCLIIDGKEIPLSEETVANIKKTLIKDEFPKFGDTYYYILSMGIVDWSKWDNCRTDKNRLAFNNCFKTKEEAEFMLERQKVLNDIANYAKEQNDKIDWINYCQNKYYFVYGHNSGRIEINRAYTSQANITYFTSDKIAEKAKELYGNRYIKYVVNDFK